MSWMFLLVGLLTGTAAGWLLAIRRPRPDPHAPGLRQIAADLAAGRRPEASAEQTPEVGALSAALERGWVPRNEERARSLQEALGRIAAFMQDQVREPLQSAVADGDSATLLEAAVRALGGLDDLEFFLREPLTPDEVHNLVPLVQQVAREFTLDWEIAVRTQMDPEPVRTHIHKGTFLDALYLLLHNAGQFGEGTTVDVSVLRDGDQAKVVIRDRGPGFTPEALERAHDLFYTTSPTSLGLGIPFARKIVESFGGRVHLRNPPDGGAEVELVLPLA